MECYSRLDAEPDPQEGQLIAATSTFEVEQIEEDLYAITTDAGRTLLHVGSKGGDTR